MYSRVGLIDQSRGYVWDSTTLTWVASPAPGGSGVASTNVTISSGVVQTQPISSSGVSLSTDTAPASTKQGLIVRQVGFTIDSSGALQVNTGPGGDTQVSISSGIVQVQPISSSGVSMSTDTAPASTKQGLIVRQVGFTIDSSGALQVNTGPGGDTQVSISSGIVQTQPISSSGVSMSTDTDPASTKQGLIVRQVGFSTIFSVSSLAGTVAAAMISPVSSAAPASGDSAVIVRQVGYSTTINVSSLAGTVLAGISTPVSSAAPASGDSAVIVRQVGYSTTVNVSSLAGTVLAAITTPVSSAAPASGDSAVIVRQVGYSTTVNVSSLAGAVITRSSAADQLITVYQSSYSGLLARVQNSTIGDLLASVQQNSTVWFTQAHFMDSSNVTPNIVGTRPTTGAQALAIRPVFNDLQSTLNSTAGNNSTSCTLVSSVASQRIKVYAFSITSTAQGNSSVSFRSSGAANYLWGADFRAPSSGMSGMNLAVTPPAWLFATEANSALAFAHQGATGTFVVSVSYFVEA